VSSPRGARGGVARGVPSSTGLAGGVCGGGGGAREGRRADAGQGPRGWPGPGPGQMRCGATPLEGIPEDATTGLCGWCRCECDDDGWEVVGDAEEEEQGVEMETMRWAMEVGVWAVCLNVGLLAFHRCGTVGASRAGGGGGGMAAPGAHTLFLISSRDFKTELLNSKFIKLSSLLEAELYQILT
jgi:hypothetical protein